MNIFRRLTAVSVAIAAGAVVLGTGSAAADRIDPLTPSGPLAFATPLQNTPEGASNRISLRAGDATIVNSGVFGGRKLRASAAGEAYIINQGRGSEGIITGQSIETGWVISCAVKQDGFDLTGAISAGGLAQFVTVTGAITVRVRPGDYVKIKLGEKSKLGTEDKPLKTGQRVGVRYQNAEMTVTGCVGNTYAYPYVKYTSSTDAFDNTKTLLGQTVYLAF